MVDQDPIQQLIDILAELVVTDYLRERAANDEASAAPQENRGAPTCRNAA